MYIFSLRQAFAGHPLIHINVKMSKIYHRLFHSVILGLTVGDFSGHLVLGDDQVVGDGGQVGARLLVGGVPRHFGRLLRREEQRDQNLTNP